MTFCTAHRPAPQVPQQTAPLPASTDRRASRPQPGHRVPEQVFTDWASI